ncbi:chromate transporter [Clostridium sp. CM028]|uniref:chromate transporter n=1 Tax=Clostridium sp. CM028 TaxID=2851575 RepID=UPI001C6E3327|nr:chromate transporter [Clostridium sp. CM028]MBW9148836.1 chromate transporter [Clostridium sp. CM028]WLC63061.1 chromate transporter [Clostridium sp. CM028]
MFWTFFKIGAFTFGGGYAMIPLIETEVVSKKQWLSKEDFMDIIVVSQTFPGALAVNSSIFIGYRINGLLGAIIGLLGVILPSFFIIICIAVFFMQFRDYYYVDLVFKGISAAVPVLILIAVVSLSKSLKKSYVNLIIILISMVSILFFNVHPVIVILLSGLYGIIFLGKKVK